MNVFRTTFLFSFAITSFGLNQSAIAADPISDIVGPVTPSGSSPWPWYDQAAKGNADEVIAAGLTHLPLLGPKAAGTFTLADACDVTLTGPGASEFNVGDWAIVGWNVPGQPPGTGHRMFQVSKINGTVMTDITACTLNGLTQPGSGLTVYHCTAQCKDAVTGSSGQDLYDCTQWGVCNLNGGGWGYYDPGLALYRMYLRTQDAKYLTLFRNFTDNWWIWALDQGGKVLLPPRGASLVSQFVRALDGHAERLPQLYATIKNSFDWQLSTEVNGDDNREPGYMLLYAAVGARADADPVRRAYYCSVVASHTNEWIVTQNAQGYWAEKNNGYAYMLPGVSPWRLFSALQGLARSYDVLNDPSVCNNPVLAARTLPVIEKAATFAYTYGYAANESRGVYYDVQYPDAGEVASGAQPGTVSVNLSSTAVTGVGTSFLKTFAPCNGTTYIGIQHSDGETWTYPVVSCADDTHLTMGAAWGSQCAPAYAAQWCAKGPAISEQFVVAAAAPTNCASLAAHCWNGAGNASSGTLIADRNNNRDLIWIMGWLFQTTATPIYKTWGDELFSASYGGPSLGPGDGWPRAAGPCGGPACDGVETDYMEAIHACAVDATMPCNPRTSYPGGNVWVFGPKRWAQGSGIGGADNYLYWRGGVANRESLQFPGNAALQVRGTVADSHYVNLHQWRVEFRVHNLPPTWTGTMDIFQTGNMAIVLQASSPASRVLLFTDTTVPAQQCTLSIGALADITVRAQEDLTGHESLRAWGTGGGELPKASCPSSKFLRTLPSDLGGAASRYTTLGGSDLGAQGYFQGNMAYFRLFSHAASSSAAEPSEFTAAGDLLDYEFDGDLSDTSGRNQPLTITGGNLNTFVPSN